MISEENFGKDPKIIKAILQAKSSSQDNAPVLIIGENGVGKKSLGQYIHQVSTRCDEPCIIVDCSRTNKNIENEILGHRDELTGRFHKGALESGNNGVVIFRNVDGLEEDFQKKIYKIFNELVDYDIDIKIVATTSKNLSKLVGAGRFLRSLYLFLSENIISITPLRERKEDIKILTQRIISEYSYKNSKNTPEVENEVWEKIVNFYWTHNIVELKNVLHGSLKNVGDSSTLQLEHIVIGDKKIINHSYEIDEDGLKLMSLKEAERLLIRKALIHTSENRTQAAKILGVSIRTLRNKINEYRNDGANYFVNLR